MGHKSGAHDGTQECWDTRVVHALGLFGSREGGLHMESSRAGSRPCSVGSTLPGSSVSACAFRVQPANARPSKPRVRLGPWWWSGGGKLHPHCGQHADFTLGDIAHAAHATSCAQPFQSGGLHGECLTTGGVECRANVRWASKRCRPVQRPAVPCRALPRSAEGGVRLSVVGSPLLRCRFIRA